MHLAPRLTASWQADRSARGLLGDAHPLARVVHRTSVALERSCVVCAVAAVSAIAYLDGARGALAYLLSSVVVQLALACDLAVLAGRRRDCARELIIEGRDDLPLAVVRRTRSRLADPARRAALADGLDSIRRSALAPVARPPASRAYFDRQVVAAAEGDLAAVTRRLRSEPAGVRGLALAERLLTDGCSPLYGPSTRALREELRRVIFLLGM